MAKETSPIRDARSRTPIGDRSPIRLWHSRSSSATWIKTCRTPFR